MAPTIEMPGVTGFIAGGGRSSRADLPLRLHHGCLRAISGSLSGLSGTTPKMLDQESHAMMAMARC